MRRRGGGGREVKTQQGVGSENKDRFSVAVRESQRKGNARCAGQSWLGFGGFAEPHDSEAGKAKADSKAHSKYIVPAELSLLNKHCKTQLQL